MKKTLSWKHVLCPHRSFGWRPDFIATAEGLGYPFACWNDRIYDTATKEDTGLTIEDVR